MRGEACHGGTLECLLGLVRVPDLLNDEGWSDAMAGCVGLMHVASPVQLPGDAKLSDEEIVAQAVPPVRSP